MYFQHSFHNLICISRQKCIAKPTDDCLGRNVSSTQFNGSQYFIADEEKFDKVNKLSVEKNPSSNLVVLNILDKRHIE